MTESGAVQPEAAKTESGVVQPNEFLALGEKGRHAWWQYILGFLISVSTWVATTIVALVVILVGSGVKEFKYDDLTGDIKGVDQLLAFEAVNVPFIFLIIATWLVARFLLNRPFQTLITTRENVDLRRVAFGFVCWSIVCCIGSIIAAQVYPGNIKLSLDFTKFAVSIPAVLLLTPIQTFGEELIYRGYILQGLRFLRNFWVIAIINGALFVIPHIGTPGLSNPWIMYLNYAVLGASLAYVTLRTKGIEVAFGAHMANNMFCALMVNYSVSSLKTSSVFVWTKVEPMYELAASAVGGIILNLLAIYLLKPRK